MELSTGDPELKQDVQIYIQKALRQPEDVLTKLFHRFSSWDRLRIAFAWFPRFKNSFVQNNRRLSDSSLSMSQTPRPDLSVNEVQVAE